MLSLAWLAQYRFQSLSRRESDWVFAFDRGVYLNVECLWRLLEGNQICITSEDHGHQFGLPVPKDAVEEINRRIAGVLPERVVLHDGTLDLDIHFAGGRVLQIIPTSCGYEAWLLHCDGRDYVATGGGELAIIGDPPAAQ